MKSTLTLVKNTFEKDNYNTDLIIAQTEKILSNLQYLRPFSTCDDEIEILRSCVLEISKFHSDHSCSFKLYSFNIYVPLKIFNKHLSRISDIQSNLESKGQIIFRWFPECSLISVRIIPTRS